MMTTGKCQHIDLTSTHSVIETYFFVFLGAQKRSVAGHISDFKSSISIAPIPPDVFRMGGFDEP